MAGYINFGVAPAISERIFKAQPDKGTIIVVGAGLAGAFPQRKRSSSECMHLASPTCMFDWIRLLVRTGLVTNHLPWGSASTASRKLP
jgi:hypothetical protein